MPVLCIESATRVCSVALVTTEDVLVECSLAMDKAHSKHLAAMVQEVLASAGIPIADLEAVAVSKGPGSYTGLRIGASFAKGVCFVTQVPLIAVNTLDAMIAGVDPEDPDVLLCPMIDARRMEVYSKVVDGHGHEWQPTNNVIIDRDSYRDLLEEHQMYFFGDGSSKCRTTIIHQNAQFLTLQRMHAADLQKPAFRKFEQNDFEDLAYFEPFYFKNYKPGKPKSLING